MSICKKLATTMSMLALASTASATQLAQTAVNVTMNVGLYASIQNLTDFTLHTSNVDGQQGASYIGSGSFNLESNGPVKVTLTGTPLTNGSDTLTTVFLLDASTTLTFNTAAGMPHSGTHTVGVEAVLGNTYDQSAGAYAGSLTITVSAI